MFTAIGHRPQTAQRLRLGTTRDGRLLAIDHEATSTRATEEPNIQPMAMRTSTIYACENVAARDRQVRLSIPSPGPMRAPGTAEANFPIESALDELSYQPGIDPIELRLRNYANVDPRTGRPWSSNALRECYRVGAQRFGWGDRNPQIGSMRDGNQLIGYGMAGVTFGQNSPLCQVKISISREGTALVRSAATDIGTGTYTIATQMAAESLGLGLGQVRVEIGDRDLPPAPASGGPQLVASKGGSDQPPAWLLNLQAHPDVIIQIGRRTFPARATVASAEERERLWPLVNRNNRGLAPLIHRGAIGRYDVYQRHTARVLPLVILARAHNDTTRRRPGQRPVTERAGEQLRHG
jgi:deazaflavin-dependent oxidoreductase (nitroreductase family)